MWIKVDGRPVHLNLRKGADGHEVELTDDEREVLVAYVRELIRHTEEKKNAAPTGERDMSKIIGLKASNVKRLKAIELRPEEGQLVVVRGNNRQGKSSLLDAIKYALGGKSTHPPRVIREGTDEAVVELETEDFMVLRRWKKGRGAGADFSVTDDETTELEVRGKDGQKMKSPQALLDKVVGDLAFDPLEFSRMTPTGQLEIVKKLTGIDTGAMERARAQFFEKRTMVNRDLSSAAARLQAMPSTKPPPPVDVAALQEKAKASRAVVAKFEDAKRGRDRIKQTIADRAEAVKVAKAALAQAEQRLTESNAHYAEADNLIDELNDDAAIAAEELVKLEGATREAGSTNAANALWAERGRAEVEVKALAESAKKLTEQIEDVDKKKADLIASAKFPVDGLGFGVDGVTLNNLPLEQASSAEQLRVSVAIGAQRNPRFKVMCVREGSLLDAESLAELGRYCAAENVQCWVEMVGEDGPASIVIRDGEAL